MEYPYVVCFVTKNPTVDYIREYFGIVSFKAFLDWNIRKAFHDCVTIELFRETRIK